VSDDAAAQLALDDNEDTALLAEDEDAILSVVAAVPLVDIGRQPVSASVRSMTSRRVPPSIQSQSILPASRTSSCLMLMTGSDVPGTAHSIPSSCASSAASSSPMCNRNMVHSKRESVSETASFGELSREIPAISNCLKSEGQIPAQSLSSLFTGD
jgi:hypothetical protein